MATTPPVLDFSELLKTADKVPIMIRTLIDSIKKPDGKAGERYAECHALSLNLKNAVNDSYKHASAADKSLQTGKRNGKAQDNAKDNAKDDEPRKPKEVAEPKQEKKQTRAEKKATNKANARASRASAETEMTGPSSDEV